MTVPPFRGAGAPIKSSIELALLSDVAGRDGGAEGGPPPAPDAIAAKLGGTSVLLDSTGESVLCGVPVPEGGPDGGRAATEGMDVDAAAEGFEIKVGVCGFAPAGIGFRAMGGLLTALIGGPLGGGGLAVGAEVSVPPFLLTHFLRSGS